VPCSVASVPTPCIVAWGRLQRKPQARLVDPGLVAMVQRHRRTLLQLMRAMKRIVEDVDLAGELYPTQRLPCVGWTARSILSGGRVEGSHMRGRARSSG
jgi:hypothetical protein